MFSEIMRGLQILMTGKELVDSLSSNRPQTPVIPVKDPIPNLQHPAASNKVRTPADRTKLSPEQIEFVRDSYKKMYLENGKLPWDQQKTTFELTQEINNALGLHKSRSAYSVIWNQKDQDTTTDD